MFSLLSEPLSSSPVGHFRKLLQRKDHDVRDGPPSLFLSPAPLPRPVQEGSVHKPEAERLYCPPIVSKMFTSLKLSRKKRAHLGRGGGFNVFNKVQLVWVCILLFCKYFGHIWCVRPSQVFFTPFLVS